MTEEELSHLNIGPSLWEEGKQQLGDLLHKYQTLFTFSPKELGDKHYAACHSAGDTLAEHFPGKRVKLVVWEIIHTELHLMQAVIAVKKDGGIYFCMDS